jgi:hypothetical protein
MAKRGMNPVQGEKKKKEVSRERRVHPGNHCQAAPIINPYDNSLDFLLVSNSQDSSNNFCKQQARPNIHFPP